VPSDFMIPANTEATVTLKNTGALPHNFSIPDQNISQDVASGATETITLNLPAGTYNFDCDEPGHKEAGMVGVLTVK
ncbi:MAG TPA: cupredoxin domain-containing protein, partial [Thermomicrobiales bacterium]|nr:cupredoxin domain-containing protein [Thermomicrobiales bacterium]